jgi:hypothetical protein
MTITEWQDDFYKLLEEVLEDIHLTNAIREGEKSLSVNRDEVFCELESQTED